MKLDENEKNIKIVLLKWLISIMIYSFILLLASKIFEDFEIVNFGYAIITSIVLVLLNYTVKPLLKVLMFPITILTTGLLYPLIDVIILKIAALIIPTGLIVKGWFVPFIVVIFISIFAVILDSIITGILERLKR